MREVTIVGEHPVMRKVAGLAERLARTSHPVLIAGEGGSGRHLVARVLHARGPRAALPLVTVDCGSVAARRAEVLAAAVKSAAGGTLFLRNLEWVEEEGQRALSSALAENGDTRLLMSRAAAPRAGERCRESPLAAAALEILLPPLRDRRCDIPLLVAHFIERERALRAAAVRVDDAAHLALWRCDWPGNVRQLREVIESALLRSPEGVLRAEDLGTGVGPTGRGAGPRTLSSLSPASRLLPGAAGLGALAAGMSRGAG